MYLYRVVLFAALKIHISEECYRYLLKSTKGYTIQLRGDINIKVGLTNKKLNKNVRPDYDTIGYEMNFSNFYIILVCILYITKMHILLCLVGERNQNNVLAGWKRSMQYKQVGMTVVDV
jgi:hypothetical protein